MRQQQMGHPSSKRSPYSVQVAPDVAYWGPPGTGKTTTLMRVIEGELRDGTPVSKIGGFTYRKNMADEFRERAVETVGGVEGDTWFKTTHAAAFALLDLTKDDTCDEDAQRQFCETYGWGWTGPADATDPESADNSPWSLDAGTSEGVGPALLRARAWCVNLGLPVSEWRKAPLSDDERDHLSDTRVADFNRQYEDWKAEEGLLDFEDMLVRCVEEELAPPVEVLIEDEFQDKTPLQVELYNVWAEKADRVYVAGDPHQAIYTYQGTDPTFMQDALELAHNQEVLDTSYRLGRSVVDYGKRILRRGGHELPEILPAGETDVERIRWADYAEFAARHEADETFHLMRANYMKKHVAGVLGEAGVPFEDNRSMGATWTARQRNLYNGVAKATRTIEEMDFGQEPTFDLTDAETKAVAEALPGSALVCKKKEVDDRVEDGAALHDLAATADLGQLLSGNPFAELEKRSSSTLVPSAVGSEAIQTRLARAFTNRGGDTIGEVSHALSTIHAAKGQERDVVFLLDASTWTIQNEAPVAEEALVFYVGATRSSGKLYIVEDSPVSKYATEVLP